MKPANFPGRVKRRRESALSILEKNLLLGTKVDKTTKETILHTEGDVKRIKKEINILKEKIK